MIGILFDATGNYDLSFAVAGGSFLFSGSLILVRKLYKMKLFKAVQKNGASGTQQDDDVKSSDGLPDTAVENNNIFVVSDFKN